ncbi:ATP-binding protein [Escherichia coli]|nr:ATP-binding protein [Escherichia coli]
MKYAGAQAGGRVSACPLRAKARHLQLDVWDNGPGLPARRGSRRYLISFARGNKESAVPGVGLGLAICRAIVDVHGGTITAFNRPEVGACFQCYPSPSKLPPELERIS